MEQSSVFSGCSLFRNMTEAERQRICACLGCRKESFRRGEALWLTGDTVSSCGVVLRGSIRAESVTASGRRTVAAIHGPGEVFGDVLMGSPGEPSPVDVFAGEETLVLFLSFHGIMGGCEKNCDIHRRLRENLLGEIGEKFWAMRRRLGYLAAGSLRGRIALYLLDRSRRCGRDTFRVNCSREDLAGLLCVNRSALSRELSRMRKEGLIDFYRDSFRLLDRSGLEEWAG